MHSTEEARFEASWIEDAKVLVAAGAIASDADSKQYYLLELAQLLGVNLSATLVEPGRKPYPDPTAEPGWGDHWQ
jgi:hypothetical protein